MSLGAHLQELKRKHAHLSAKVEEAQRSPGTDDLAIRRVEKGKTAPEGRDYPARQLSRAGRAPGSGGGPSHPA